MRVHVLTLGHAPARILRAGVERLYETRSKELEFTHWLVDHHYPLRHAEVRAEIDDLARRFGCSVLDPGRNLGLHGGANWAFKRMGLEPGDVLVTYDPDSYPLREGWLSALVRAVAEGGLAVACLSLVPHTRRELDERGYTRSRLAGLEVDEPRVACMMSVSAFDWRFVRDCGGFDEPNAHYGGLEVALWSQLKGRRWGYLTEYGEDHRLQGLQDEEYRQWKVAHAHRGDPRNFDEWVIEKHPSKMQ